VTLNNLNTSKILFTPDGCVKIGMLIISGLSSRTELISQVAFLNDYQASTSTHARPLGVIAIEMMQDGIPPDPGHDLILRHLDQWSPEAANFLAVASWGNLDDLDNVSHARSIVSIH
jgi:hypothetical protein